MALLNRDVLNIGRFLLKKGLLKNFLNVTDVFSPDFHKPVYDIKTLELACDFHVESGFQLWPMREQEYR